MKVIRQSEHFRLIEGIGQHMNKRYEVQKRYRYYENDKWIYSWSLEFHSTDLDNCIKAYERRENSFIKPSIFN